MQNTVSAFVGAEGRPVEIYSETLFDALV